MIKGILYQTESASASYISIPFEIIEFDSNTLKSMFERKDIYNITNLLDKYNRINYIYENEYTTKLLTFHTRNVIRKRKFTDRNLNYGSIAFIGVNVPPDASLVRDIEITNIDKIVKLIENELGKYTRLNFIDEDIILSSCVHLAAVITYLKSVNK